MQNRTPGDFTTPRDVPFARVLGQGKSLISLVAKAHTHATGPNLILALQTTFFLVQTKERHQQQKKKSKHTETCQSPNRQMCRHMTEPKLDHSTRVCVCVRLCPKHARSHRIKRNRPNVFQGSLPKFISRICGATSNTHTHTTTESREKKQQQEAKEFFAQPCVSTTTNHRRAAPTFNTTQNDHASSSSKHAAAFVRSWWWWTTCAKDCDLDRVV